MYSRVDLRVKTTLLLLMNTNQMHMMLSNIELSSALLTETTSLLTLGYQTLMM